MTAPDVEGLLRELARQALGAVARRYGEFAEAEDAVQEALVTAAAQWPAGLPDRPLSWLITVASRRLVDEYHRTDARRRREELASSLSIHPEATVPSSDDSLVLLFLCCDDTLSSTLSIPLTLRAVAGRDAPDRRPLSRPGGDDGAAHQPGKTSSAAAVDQGSRASCAREAPAIRPPGESTASARLARRDRRARAGSSLDG